MMIRNSVLVCVGLLLLVIGTLISVSYNTITHLITTKVLTLAPTSTIFHLWQKTPMPLSMKVYFFNWTNPEELMLEGFKPNLVEVGPYYFKEYIEKTNVTWNQNRTISYAVRRTWITDEENSNGSLSDRILSLNAVAVSAAYAERHSNSLLRYTLSNTMRFTGQKVWTSQTVGDLLFYGYSDPLLTLANKMQSITNKQVPGDKFAWFYKWNASSDYEGLFNMETGEDDMYKLGLLRTWNYKNQSDSFAHECGHITGSTGELNPPGQRRDKPLEIFNTEFCKSLKLHYSEDTEVLGVPGYKYVGGRDIMDSGTIDPANWCNCEEAQCPPQGILNVSLCHYGSPGFMSYPHFLYADPYYASKVNGMHPDPEKHSLHVTLEPKTGTPLDVVGRFQINLLLQPHGDIALFRNVPTIYFPMLWLEKTASIPNYLAFQLNILLHLPTIGLCISIILIITGVVMLAVVIVPRYRQQFDFHPHKGHLHMSVFQISALSNLMASRCSEFQR
ncbi:protein croquemort-like isoform X2 [Periplaneta americana]|uniref:protein croquemort-like isoform X2 n=1 Tax=Periplaneta americana TaxID=6978 RepID=UPI0037E9C737